MASKVAKLSAQRVRQQSDGKSEGDLQDWISWPPDGAQMLKSSGCRSVQAEEQWEEEVA